MALREFAALGRSAPEIFAFYEWLRDNPDLLGKEMSVYSPARRLEVHETFRESNRRVRAEFIDGKAEDLFDDPAVGDSDQWLAEIGDTTAVSHDLMIRFAERAVELEAPEEA